MLKNIQRRKSSQVLQVGHYVRPSIEIGKSGFEGEIEKLRTDKNLLLQEVVTLQHEHHQTVHQVDMMKQRLLAAEQRQKQMVSFLGKVLQNPVFLDHLQRQKEQRKAISTRVKRKFLKQQQASPSNLDSSLERQIVWYRPSWTDATKSTVMKESEPDAGKQLPDYLLQDVKGKLGLDVAADPKDQIESIGSDELEQELVEASHQIGMGTPILPVKDPEDVLFKGKNVVSFRDDMSSGGSEYFISFPEDLSPEKMTSALTPVAEAEHAIKQEDVWSIGFDTGESHPRSSHDVWENLFSSNIPELEVFAGLSNLWDFGSEQQEEGLGIDKWVDDEPAFDDLETHASQLEDYETKNMYP